VTITIPTLSATAPGFLGVLHTDSGLRSLWRFAEGADTVAPVDDLLAVEDTRPATVYPAAGTGYTGPARVFDGSSSGVAATDPGRLLLQRTVTVVALVKWDHASATGAETVVAHGARGSAAERRSWQLRLTEPAAGTGRVAWVWEDRSGTEYVQSGGDFLLPATDFLLLVATREWAGDRFVLRYWMGETLLAEVESTDMEVGGGLDATLTIGCVGDGAGGFEEYFHGSIDQLAVFDEAFTQARVSNLWQRVSYWQPGAYATLCALQPPGRARSTDDSSNVRRRLRVQAGLLGVLAADAALRQSAGLPDRAFGGRLEGWEHATGIAPRPTQTIAARQAAVLAALLGAEGLSEGAVLENLAPLYGLSDLEVIRYDNVTRGVDYPAWDERGDGGVLVDEPDDEVTLRVPAFASWSTVLGDYAYRTAIGAEPVITATVEATSLSNDDLFVGFVDPLGTFAGVRLDTSASNLVNTISGATIAAYVLPVTVRVFLGGGSVKAQLNGAVAVTLGDTPAGLTHAQVALIPTTSTAPATARSAKVSDLRVVNYDSRSTQVGYVYADAAADLPSARRQLSRQQPAHAHCAALVGKRAVVCDDDLDGSDTAPCVESSRDYLLSWFPGIARAWAGNAVDLVSGELLTATGSADIDAGAPHDGPFGDQCLVFTAGMTDTWTMPNSVLNFTSSKTTALLLVFNIDSFTPGTEYTLIGNREGANLNGFEIAIDTSGNLVVRFDSGAAAPTEIALLPANLAPDLWHTLVLRYDHTAELITVTTELELGTASFSASASSTMPTALGAYRALPTPAWRCALAAVLDEEAAEAFDPVARAKYVHRTYANYQDHVENLRWLLGQGVAPDLSWGASSIDDASLAPMQRSGSASLLQVALTELAGPFGLAVSGSQAWVASDPTMGHLDTDRSALIVVGADLVSFTAAAFEDFCGDRTVVLNAGWELFMHSSSVPAIALDDNTGVAIQALLTGASATIGKHVYLLRWVASTQQATFVSEVDSATLNFAGRSPVNTDAFRIGKTRADLNGVNWTALSVAFFYTDALDSLSAAALVSLAAALKARL
jgi:hypothetical protein